MASEISGQRAMYSALRKWNTDTAPELFGAVVDRIKGNLFSLATGEGGTIPQSSESTARRFATDAVLPIFTAPYSRSVYPDGRSPFAEDGVTPLSPYAREINEAIANVTVAVVMGHHKYIRRRMPDDIMAWLQAPTTDRIVSEQSVVFNAIFRPNPLANYERAHTWVDPNGYRLSDRVWRASQSTRDKVDRLITEAIRQGRGSQEIAADLERFLLPNRQNLRTRAPYGTDASYDAMRIARTEIARAHAEASLVSAQSNPFVSGMDWMLSPVHGCCDICDEFATIRAGERIKEPYPIGSSPLPVVDTHPQCMCSIMPAPITVSRDEIINELRASIERGRRPNPTPAAPIVFLNSLLGEALVRQFAMEIMI